MKGIYNMDKKYESLFTPWKVGNVEIKNRSVMCPMGGTSLFGWFELGGCHFDKEAAKLYAGKAEFYSIDVDANEELANQYGIEAMPTIIIIDANGKKTTNVGLVDLNALKSMIDAAL